jgi:hypothetical protein
MPEMLHNGGNNARQLDSLSGSDDKSSQDHGSDTGDMDSALILMFNLTNGKGITIFNAFKRFASGLAWEEVGKSSTQCSAESF